MKCPFSFDNNGYSVECMKNKRLKIAGCVLWDTDRNMCDISTAARSLRIIADELRDTRRATQRIADAMAPEHVEQPRIPQPPMEES